MTILTFAFIKGLFRKRHLVIAEENRRSLLGYCRGDPEDSED